MKSVMAGLGGALLATLALTAFQAKSITPAAEPLAGPGAQGSSLGQAAAVPMAVQCAPGQQAVVRQIVANGKPLTAAECTGAAETPAAAPVPAMDLVEMQSPRVVPAAYTPAVYQAPAPRVVSEREAKPKRSWKKTALVIGGSAGAGAGIGGLTGGKKGALIGAAIGGGAASIYEAVKRK